MIQLIRRLSDLFKVPRGGVITIGNFDGVHLGHEALLQSVIASARALKGPAIAMTFEPQPQEFFRGEHAVPRITPWRQKVSLLAAAGMDVVVMLPFDAALALWSAERFMQDLLREGLGVKRLVTGADFQFGHDRMGTVGLLQAQPDWTVEVLPDRTWQGERISSSCVRQALLNADFTRAAACLGRPWTMEGRVVYGEQRGRQLGSPTANIILGPHAAPVSGVYAVRATIDGKSVCRGVANVGTRPTVGGKRRLLEVHLFQFSDEIYGCRLRVEFCKKLREECRFASLDQLKEQIGNDVKAAVNYFASAGN